MTVTTSPAQFAAPNPQFPAFPYEKRRRISNLSRMRNTLRQPTIGTAIVMACIACATARPPAHAGTDDPSMQLLLPGSSLLQPPSLGDDSQHVTLFVKQATGDTVEHRMTEARRGFRAVPGQRDELLLTTVYSPPNGSVDSATILRHGFAPVREYLEFRGVFRYQYSRNHVWGTVQRQDSAPRAFDQTFPHDVFAFSEAELLVRSLPFNRGATFVAPLFSEFDAALEMDTMTVIGPDSATSARNGWVIRFADPAIVRRFVVSAQSRQILSDELSQRRSAARVRFVTAP